MPRAKKGQQKVNFERRREWFVSLSPYLFAPTGDGSSKLLVETPVYLLRSLPQIAALSIALGQGRTVQVLM